MPPICRAAEDLCEAGARAAPVRRAACAPSRRLPADADRRRYRPPRLEARGCRSDAPGDRVASPRAAGLRALSAISSRYAGEKRDISSRTSLRRLMRPVRVSPGQIEIALEPGARRACRANCPQARGLDRRSLDGARRARRRREAAGAAGARGARYGVPRSARASRRVRPILERFPGAEIVDVRDPSRRAAEADEDGVRRKGLRSR